MSAKTKIIVLKSKELIYTGIFVVLGILLVLLLIYMFSDKDKDNKSDAVDAPDQINQIEQVSEEATDVSYISGDTVSDSDNETIVIPPSDDKAQSTTDTYKSGVYTSVLNIGGQTELQLVTTVDNGRVSHVELTNISDAVTVMYPLITPSVNEINAQLDAGLSIDEITYSGDNKYTATLILQAVKSAISLQ